MAFNSSHGEKKITGSAIEIFILMYLSYRRKRQQYFRHCGVATGVDLKSIIKTTRKYEKEQQQVWKFYLKA